jgi:hypothetical protein
MVATNARNATDKYRAKAYELLSLAERAGDPAQRADLLRFARMWLTLTLSELRGSLVQPFFQPRQINEPPGLEIA